MFYNLKHFFKFLFFPSYRRFIKQLRDCVHFQPSSFGESYGQKK